MESVSTPSVAPVVVSAAALCPLHVGPTPSGLFGFLPLPVKISGVIWWGGTGWGRG